MYILLIILWQQGACIVTEKDKQVISVGFSGYPESMDRRAVQKVENMKDQYSGDPYSK